MDVKKLLNLGSDVLGYSLSCDALEDHLECF